MRVTDGNKEFCQWLLDIGDGVCLNKDGDTAKVPIPESMRVASIQELIQETFPNLQYMKAKELMDSAIFSTVNEDVWEINQICLKFLPGERRIYLSTDSVEEETVAPVLKICLWNSIGSLSLITINDI